MTTLQTALSLHLDGISTIPVRPDKVSAIKWQPYQTKLPTVEELTEWFADGKAGIAVLGGVVQCLDFDEKYSVGIFSQFRARAEEIGLGGVVSELLRQKTPSGGYHLVWRCKLDPVPGNQKLASKLPREVNGSIVREHMIETRGMGGYFLCAPSPGYVVENGGFNYLPWISSEDHEALIDLAQSFSEHEEQFAPAEPTPAPTLEGLTPADDYDRKADVPALLKAYGWKPCGRGEKYWTRPGKKSGVSATWNVIPGRFYVFSSNADPLETRHVYKPCWLYAALACGGDRSVAVSSLRRQGFGGARAKPAAKTLAEYLDEAEQSDPPEMELGPHPDSGVEGIGPATDVQTTETDEERLDRILNAREFDPALPPPKPRPIFEVRIGTDQEGHEIWTVVSTPGNLTSIVAPPKVGKTSWSSAMIASTTVEYTEADLLGVRSANPEEKAVLVFDTEQSPDDFWHGMDRVRKRARKEHATDKPAWLHAWRTSDLAAPVTRKAVGDRMAKYAALHGGIHSVFIDGVADLLLDVNNAEECNSLVSDLMALAVRYDCPIVGILHQNPGSDKSRGHIGSQMERKSETNLRIEKDDTCSIVWSNRQRRAPIEKTNGPRFAWSDDAKMHVTIAGDTTGLTFKAQSKVEEFAKLGMEVFQAEPLMTWTELYTALKKARETPDGAPTKSTLSRWIAYMAKNKVITMQLGRYVLNPNLTPTNSDGGGNGGIGG